MKEARAIMYHVSASMYHVPKHEYLVKVRSRREI